MTDVRHGYSGYAVRKCRCAICRAAWRAYHAAWRARQDAPMAPPHVHGTKNGYGNYGCRCADCKAAQAAYFRAWRARRKAAAS